jgi:hypothetical protein
MELAVNAGYTTSIVVRFMWLFGMSGYILLFYTGIKTMFDVLSLWDKAVRNKRGLD